MSQGAKLPERLDAEVCIIGAGIAGLTTAYLLAREGRRVAVLDADRPGTGMTARTTAHLSGELDDRLSEVERIHGLEGLRLAVESHRAAIDRVEDIVRAEGIACGFRRLDGYLFNAPGQDPKILDEELASAHRIGWSEVEAVERAPISGFDSGRGLRFPNQAQFHPLAYLAGLHDALGRSGGIVYRDAHVTEVINDSAALVKTASGACIYAESIVIATNSPITNRVMMHTKMHPYLTYAVALEIESGSIPNALYWDTADPYHYVRLSENEGRTYLIVGGEDHKTGQGDHFERLYDRLESWARQRFPGIRGRAFHWSGQVMETIDGLAFIGRNPLSGGNQYIATGDSGMGMTHGTIAGMLLTDLILGRSNPWAALYDPARKPVKTLRQFVTENANMALQYRDYLTGSDVSSVDDIARGRGAVIREGTRKAAVYRDGQGNLHRCSAICPHLGGIVRWNYDEKTWDCPVHGSRFSALGECIQGPAFRGLTPEAEEKRESA